jgi:predicted metal-dependent hydrolase
VTERHDRSGLFEQGLEAYRSGQHYEAHEFWEELWQDERDEDRSRFLQALIQVASAVHKARFDVAPRGALSLFDRATQRLEGLPDAFMGIDVAGLKSGIARCREAVERELESGGGHCRLDARHAPPMETVGANHVWWQSTPAPTVPDAARGVWFERGLQAYAAGEYFEAHELWEELWRDEPPEGDKVFLQGLIQVAAAMHKVIAHRKPEPAARLLGRALHKLRDAPQRHRGIDVARVVREAEQARRVLLTLADADGFTPELVPRIVRDG